MAADVDFSQSEATSEEFKPNQGADASISIRSQQTTEQSGSSGAMPSGVPGAASNQPPVAATAPLVGASQPLQAAPLSGGGANGRREAVTNYEVDKTVRVTRNATGTVKRLSAAVVVNNRSVVDPKGKTTQVALSGEELDKLTALVRESIGYKQDRGDSVKVINAPFRIETIPNVEVPLVEGARQPRPGAFVRDAGRTGPGRAAGLLRAGPPGAEGADGTAGAPARQQAECGRGRRAVAADAGARCRPPRAVEQLESAKQLARQNPAAVAGILRGWVGTDQPASR